MSIRELAELVAKLEIEILDLKTEIKSFGKKEDRTSKTSSIEEKLEAVAAKIINDVTDQINKSTESLKDSLESDLRITIQEEINKIPRTVGTSSVKTSTPYKFYPSQPPTGTKGEPGIIWQKKDIPLTKPKSKKTSQIPDVSLKKIAE